MRMRPLLRLRAGLSAPWGAGLLALALVLVAPAAGATGLYAEVLTSGASLLPPGQRMRVDLGVAPHGLVPRDATFAADAALGDGHLRAGEWVTWSHVFAPGKRGAVLEEASLQVVVRDPSFGVRETVAEIHLDGTAWKEEGLGRWSFLPHTLGGHVTSYLVDDEVHVGFGAPKGSFHLLSSTFVARYDTPGAGPAIPEPGAATVFALGALLVRGRLRRPARAA